MTSLADAVAARNRAVARAGRWRTVRVLHGGGVRTRLDDGHGPDGGTEVVHFASNDYLGLSQHPAVVAAAKDALDTYGAGAGASRLLVGHRPVHEELEVALAARAGTEAALVFPTGFAANLGVLGALVAAGGRHDTLVVSDELNHASIIDGLRAARAEVVVTPHLRTEAVADALAARRQRHAIVVTDAVFSMDGDLAPVEELARICAELDATLVLDEAHSVLGPALPRVECCHLVVVGTLSKTLGSLGGYVAADRATVELLVNTARSFIFTTGSTPADAAAALAAVRIETSGEGDALRTRLRGHVETVRPGHPTPIVPVVLGEEAAALAASRSLLERGLLVPAIRPPTVPAGTCRLRVALSAAHETDDVARLVAALAELDPTGPLEEQRP
ncbi:MAG: aminotransferase class I/II-fold pyridoxal phosphate-dependent enzyme [Microthrixaceae bacterium]